MPKPNTSVVELPRPVPNSKRPSERWSSMATRSATRAGWFTGGVVLKIAEPTWMRDVLAATKERNTSGAGMCEYSVRKWCSGHHTYLMPWRSHSTAKSRFSMRRRCSASGSTSDSDAGTKAWAKYPNSICDCLLCGAPLGGQGVEGVLHGRGDLVVTGVHGGVVVGRGGPEAGGEVDGLPQLDGHPGRQGDGGQADRDAPRRTEQDR